MIQTKIIGRSPQIKELLLKLERISQNHYPVLILGESGTGKELIAEAIHNLSPRKDKPFVIINCNALNENLLESELFGHRRGSFTGASRSHEGKLRFADGGTVFLDEIGDISESVQVKLLRVIENQEVQSVGYNGSYKINIRFICATNKNINPSSNPRFREDLYHRISTLKLDVPPLKSRTGDALLLAQHFLYEIAGHDVTISETAKRALYNYTWPGNVRELKNVITRSFILSDGETISNLEIDFSASVNFPETPGLKINLPETSISLKDIEKCVIIEALKKFNWSQLRTSAFLHVTPRVLNYKIKIYNIKHPSWPKHS